MNFNEITERLGSALDSDFLMAKNQTPGVRQAKKSESNALLQPFHHFPCNENPTRALNTTSSTAAWHQLTLLTGGKNSRMRMKVPPDASALNLNPIGFRIKRKGRILSSQSLVYELVSSPSQSKNLSIRK